ATPEAALGAPVAPEQISIAAATTSAVRRTLNPAAGVNGVFSITAKADLTWRNAPLSLADTRAGRPSIPCYWVIGPFDNKGGGTVDTPQPVETDPFQADTTYKGKGGKEVRWAKVLRPDTLAVDREHIVPLWDMYRAENASAYVLVWVVAPSRVDAELAVGSDDGVVAWLNDQRIHANLVSRGYQSREDRAAVSLKAGANKLLFRITQGGGEWKMAAHILDRNGAPLPELKYSLEPPAEKP
ncbi:MAG: hypothetical protein NTW87_24350, partial [Planctomycetota bacterium]|nr:hypothetical protein [Planctomycetota bacterium]